MPFHRRPERNRPLVRLKELQMESKPRTRDGPVTAEHPTAADLFAFSCGVLDRSFHAEIESHVQVCAQCLNLLALLPDAPLAKRARQAVREVGVGDPTPMPSGGLRADP